MNKITKLLAFKLLTYMLKKTDNTPTADHSEVRPLVSIKFYGGPLDGMADKAEKLMPNIYLPHIPKDEEGRTIAGYTQAPGGGDMVLFEAVYAKYSCVGDDGSYFFQGDLTPQEMNDEIK